MMREVAVTGMGAITPLGLGAPTLHERWCAGASGIEGGVGAATDFDPRDHLAARDVRRADRFTQLALVAAQEATTQAGWDGDSLPYDRTRVGCVIGTGVGGIATIERSKEILLEHGASRIPPLAVPLMMSNAAAGALSIRYGIRGTSYGTVAACAAGAQAIVEAARLIRCGDADAVLTGGSEAPLTALSTAGFTSLAALSPSGTSRPFDRRRDGFVMGEGAGVLVLEAQESAVKRGAPVLATIRGSGATSDAYHLTAPHPGGETAAAAIRAALSSAGLAAESVTYVNAHGTSTQLNDRSETNAIKLALGKHAARVAVSSAKSAIGHLLGAAGAVEAIATILALRNRIAPPTLGWEEPDEGMDLDYVPGRARPLGGSEGPLVGLSNSFGFGGHNVVLCFES
ncbi:MAG: beta-ketoacyl-ACP synthase II [Solirubrobacteraceae bacterium]